MAVTMSGIIKHSKGYGFKITFPTIKKANHYKDMLHWLIKDDNIPLIYNTGHYDQYKDGEKKQ